MEMLEYKMDANQAGNLVVPYWIDRSRNGYFFNPANYTYIGFRLSPAVKVPDSVLELTRADLKVRCKIPGVMMERVTPEAELTQMSDEDIDIIVDDFCDEHGVA